MSTTTALSPWAIVDQIIRQEIPDAVPGCGYLRMMDRIADNERVLWITLPSIIGTILDHECESHYRRALIKHLARRVIGMICDLKYDEAVDGDANGYLEKNVELIRKTLAEIKGAN